uniref:(northern house mosquito) hypothetical protein n=1 Tax=Culex pipiens TaxID=7175 RepID=A0A8D8N9V6_CULPI
MFPHSLLALYAAEHIPNLLMRAVSCLQPLLNRFLVFVAILEHLKLGRLPQFFLRRAFDRLFRRLLVVLVFGVFLPHRCVGLSWTITSNKVDKFNTKLLLLTRTNAAKELDRSGVFCLMAAPLLSRSRGRSRYIQVQGNADL